MNTQNHFYRGIQFLALSLVLLLAACASPAIEEAKQLGRMGHHEEAMNRLKLAIEDRPNDNTLRRALISQRDEAVSELMKQGMAAQSAGQIDEAANVLQRLMAVAPQHPRTQALKQDLDRVKRLQRLMSEAQQAYDARAFDRAESTLRTLTSEDVYNRRAREMLASIEEMRDQQSRQQSTVVLATAQKPITLEFREAPLKNVFEALARAANVNFVFDREVRGESKVTLFLRNTTVDQALRVILNTQQLAYKLLNDNTVMVFPATQQKQRDVLDTVTKTFYLTNADPKQVQTLIRTVAKTKDLYVDERLNMLVVRDNPDVMRLVERLIQSVDLPDPEVMLEMEVMEVSSKKLDQIGLSLPETGSYGVPGSTAPIASRSGLHWYAANPLAVATLKSSNGATNLLANPKIRARNREKAKVLLGEKLPIFTTTSTANVGVSASVTYLDVGLKLEVEPQVQLDNEVTIKVALEVSSITDKVSGPQGSIAYQVGTRQASTTLRLRDGETQILAGLINDNENRTATGVPGLHQLPLAGRLFGVTTDGHDKTEVVLLVTPRIVRNIIRPAVSATPLPSGTDSQPGMPPMLLPASEKVAAHAGLDASGSVGLSTAPAGGGALPSPATARALQATRPHLTGPEEVMPGATFQVTVHNPTKAPLNTQITFDTNVFELASGLPAPGKVDVEVPAQAEQVVTLRAKGGFPLVDAAIGLEATGQSLALRVRDPNAPLPSDDAGGSNEPHTDNAE